MLEGFTVLLTRLAAQISFVLGLMPSQMSFQVDCPPYFLLEKGPSVPMILL